MARDVCTSDMTPGEDTLPFQCEVEGDECGLICCCRGVLRAGKSGY
jgi:hypothetical protein